LPSGFQYSVLSEEGSSLTDGRPVPGDHDAMAAFETERAMTVLVRNHELGDDEGPATEGSNPYDSSSPGGTTAIVVGSDHEEIESYVVSSGTIDNCAGGATPWGTWLTCEETTEDGHGYVFEVMPDDRENGLSKTPIRDMGVFSHEAAGVDPDTGVVYLTEDAGPISFLYRFIPDDASGRPGALHQGGTLQALAIDQQSGPDAASFAPAQRFRERWLEVDPEDAHADAMSAGAVRFNRLEGAYFAGGALWFNDTKGGDDELGQTFRYIATAETLELFFESTSSNDMKSPDNAVITPWGDFCFVEDASSGNRIMGVTPNGDAYEFGSNQLNESEFAGPCFAPDGQTMFVNIQEPGLTLAIWGPFKSASLVRQQRMSHAGPPRGYGPPSTGELIDAAARNELTTLQAAAYDRLGVPVLG